MVSASTIIHTTQKHAVGMGETAIRLKNKNKNNSLVIVKFPLSVQFRPCTGMS